MYEFPYGAGQQLNLNWIINEIITLHKQLDPDWDLPQFDTAFPYTNLNTLNLDWILRELKAIKDLAPTEDAQLLKMVANALIANTYDATTQYNVDDIVYRDSDNRLYKCITATPAGGEPFDSNKWVEVDVGGVLTDLLTQSAPVQPYDNNPAMDGTASAGTSTQYARGDHVHPKDAARVPTSRTVNGKALSSNITLNASDIPNDSNVTGVNIDDALEALLDLINTVLPFDTTPMANSDKGVTSAGILTALENVIKFARKDTATSDISTSVDAGLYVWYVTSNTPDWGYGSAVILVISFATWLQAQLGYNANGEMYFRNYNAGTWTSWEKINTSTKLIVPPPAHTQSSKVNTNFDLSGSINYYVVQTSGWYQARAVNIATTGQCVAQLCNGDGSEVYSNIYMPDGTYKRAPTAWLYYKAGQTLYFRLWATDNTYSGLFYAPETT